MKQISHLLILIFLFIVNLGYTQSYQINDTLKNSPKFVKETSYDTRTIGKIIIGSKNRYYKDTRKTRYNKNNKKLEVVIINAKNPRDFHKETYEYDSIGNLIITNNYSPKDKPAKTKETYEYDTTGRLLTEKYYSQRHDDYLTNKYAYKINGDVTETISSTYRDTSLIGSSKTVCQYDYKGRLINKKKYYGNDDISYEYIYEYFNGKLKVKHEKSFDKYGESYGDDGSNYDRISKYDKNGNLLEELTIKDARDTIDQTIYKYYENHHGVIVIVEDFDTGSYHNSTSKSWLSGDNYKRVYIHVYDKENNILETQFFRSYISKESEQNKPLEEMIFLKNDIDRNSFIYKFDKNGNWTKVTMIDEKLKPIWVWKRKIKYFK